MRPLIGICAALERAQWGVWDLPAYLLARTYVDSVQRAGGGAVLLPYDPVWIEDPDEVLDRIDGLMLAGGSDVGPDTYGAEVDPATAGVVPERDAVELALTKRAFERDMPFLGICRGMQVMNVAAGGTLIQHLPDSHGHEDHRRVLGGFDGADHSVRLAEGSLAERAAGGPQQRTLSHHHQGVDRIGEGLQVTGWSDLDDLPEAIERPDLRFALGVQWHPEEDETSRLIAALVAEAVEARGQ